MQGIFSFSPSFPFSFPPLSLIYNKSFDTDHLASSLHFLPFPINNEHPSPGAVTPGYHRVPQGTAPCLWFSHIARGSVPALLQLQPVTHLCVTSWKYCWGNGSLLAFRQIQNTNFHSKCCLGLPGSSSAPSLTHTEPSPQVQELLSSKE